MGFFPILRAFLTNEDGALAVHAAVVAVSIAGLSLPSAELTLPDLIAAQSAAEQIQSAPSSREQQNAPEAQMGPVSVCTPNGGHCAVDNNGDGFVDELRNLSRGTSLNVEGNGITIQGYRDGGWS